MTTIYRGLLMGFALIIGIVNADAIAAGINRAKISKISTICYTETIRPGIVCADIERNVIEARIPIVA